MAAAGANGRVAWQERQGAAPGAAGASRFEAPQEGQKQVISKEFLALVVLTLREGAV